MVGFGVMGMGWDFMTLYRVIGVSDVHTVWVHAQGST